MRGARYVICSLPAKAPSAYAAAALGTVRAQIKEILRKVRVHRQVELVAKLNKL